MKLLKIAAALSALALSGCVVLPLPLYGHRHHGYHSPPPHLGGEYQPPRRRW